MIKVAICDDDKNIVKHLEKLISENFHEKFIISKFFSGEELEKSFSVGLIFDILIIDVDLISTNGISLSKKLKAKYENLKVILLTGYVDYCEDIFNTNPSYLLLKPIKVEKLVLSLNRVMEEMETDNNEFISIKLKDSISKIKLKNIKYIESINREVLIYNTEQNQTVYQKLDEFEKILPKTFIRCHKSFLVNMNFVKQMDTKNFTLFDGTNIPISQSKYRHTKNKFLKIIDGEL